MVGSSQIRVSLLFTLSCFNECLVIHDYVPPFLSICARDSPDAHLYKKLLIKLKQSVMVFLVLSSGVEKKQRNSIVSCDQKVQLLDEQAKCRWGK